MISPLHSKIQNAAGTLTPTTRHTHSLHLKKILLCSSNPWLLMQAGCNLVIFYAFAFKPQNLYISSVDRIAQTTILIVMKTSPIPPLIQNK